MRFTVISNLKNIKHVKEKLFVTLALALLAAVMYASPISCLFLHLFGARCPGCGMTRALIAALQFDFKAAFSYHAMFWSLPILNLCFLFDGKLFSRRCWNVILYVLLGIGFFVNWIVHLAK